MCGIVAAFDKKKDVNEDVLLQFEDQSSRGTNGFGSMFIDDKGKFNIMRATGQIKAILDIKLAPTKMLIFHHRQPSSSKNKISQTHPIKISAGDLKHDYYIVHNGVIHNHEERKKVHNDELGYVYSTEVEGEGWGGKKESMYNDSETLGYDIARFIEGQDNKIETVGSAAFIMAQIDKKSEKVLKVFYGRNNGNPLKLAKSRDFLFLSSEGKGEEIKPDMLYSFSPDDFKITKKKMAISTYRTVVSNDGKDKGDETKPKGTVKQIGFNSYNYDDDDYYGGYGRTYGRGVADDEWMSFEEEEELDKYFNAAQLELDNLREAIKEATHGEELYLLDTEDIVKNIAVNVARGVEYARNLKISEYMASPEDDGAIREGETVELPEKTASK